jgi:hypothetical protein
MKRIIIGVAVMLVLITALPSFSQTPDAKSLVMEMKEVLKPSRTSVRSFDLISTNAQGEQVTFSLMQANKKLSDGKRMLVVGRTPIEVVFLFGERVNGQLPVYEYLIPIRRVKEFLDIVASSDNFYTTDFTYADLGFIPTRGKYQLLGEEQHNGIRSYKVEESLPKEKAETLYSRIVTWIAADTKLPLERDYYDVAGDLWKREMFKDIAIVDGMPTSMDIVMEDIPHNSRTELKVTAIRYDVKIPDELFMPKNLAKALDASTWRELKNVSPK